MSENETKAPASLLPFAERVRLVHTDAPFRWLAAGWSDFRHGRGISAAYSLVFVVGGFVLTAGLVMADLDYLIAPLTTGFMLVGPALTVGFYAISRDLEAGREPSLSRAFSAWLDNPGPLFAMGLALVVFLVVWLRFAALVFALSFPDVGFDWERAVTATLFTANGLTFLLLGTAVGGVMATFAFVAGAFSLPLMLDRRIGLLEALVTSATAVVLNPRAMAVWAGLILLFTAAGLASWYLGLCVTLPLIGHATWHAYRGVIRPL
ncbi:conserved membrane protein of unknown function [Rhodovastum atsumiense]|uniref:DUF2189 domain-containing protein n=1 Tax=Rhodovastum atsumiense TaxID=504468 RepID=A0A5M6J274_9PROT|nr:DUF2189 domain-containing protein [Rhodovastum atsumiense]KAA5613698.1 DUF2189 domain-containing protein [Rhodovastum atsumiense]CAH2599618.1 conserved membrane protein of unknown function [Rhodovastum atsumiense]